MKKLLLLLFVITSFTVNAQDVTVRGIDLSKTFVVSCTAFQSSYNDKVEAIWNEALFESGLEVGTYFTEKVAKDTRNREMLLKENLVIKGSYLIEITDPKKVVIRDMENNSKLVGTIKFKKGGASVFSGKGLDSSKEVLKAIEILIKEAN
tara:strand:+ start:411 stop:860 length:450 start_codon:yes stop_codon:yes gene_type:complete